MEHLFVVANAQKVVTAIRMLMSNATLTTTVMSMVWRIGV